MTYKELTKENFEYPTINFTDPVPLNRLRSNIISKEYINWQNKNGEKSVPDISFLPEIQKLDKIFDLIDDQSDLLDFGLSKSIQNVVLELFGARLRHPVALGGFPRALGGILARLGG